MAELQSDPHHFGEVKFLQSIARPGMNALEVGAHDGVTTVTIAKAVGQTACVCVFEPVPEYFAALTENLSRNGVENVRPYQLAVTEQRGQRLFYKHGGGSGIVPEDGAEQITVKTTTIDDFLRDEGVDRINLINMDCEGSELLVLRGAEATLRKNQVQIFCEIHRDYLASLGQSVDDIVGYLEQLDFQVKPVLADDLSKDVGFGSCSHIYAW